MTLRLLCTLGLIAGLAGAAAAAPPEQLYAQTCVACHGVNGKGVIPGMPDMTARGGPLASKSEAELVRSILNGVQSTRSPIAMPPKGGNPALTEADAAALVKFLRVRFDLDQN
jgi:mono/diheme cytochrome c family protein